MWWTLSAGVLVVGVGAMLLRRLGRRTPSSFDAGAVSPSWLAEHKSSKTNWH
jgi:hypothetical protein